jgi:hypothetical protein
LGARLVDDTVWAMAMAMCGGEEVWESDQEFGAVGWKECLSG